MEGLDGWHGIPRWAGPMIWVRPHVGLNMRCAYDRMLVLVLCLLAHLDRLGYTWVDGA